MKRKSKALKLSEDISDLQKVFLDVHIHEQDYDSQMQDIFPICICVNKLWTVSKTISVLMDKIRGQVIDTMDITQLLPYTGKNKHT